jgi:uncharacterized protein YerC
MTKVSRKPIKPAALSEYLNNLWSAFTLMDSKENIRLLFKDLFTSTEYKMFAKRLEIARRLLDGDTYDQIMRALNVGAPTITHVNNRLESGNGGLQKAVEKLNQADLVKRKRENERIKRLENPLRAKLDRKPILAIAIKSGVVSLKKKVAKGRKLKSASRSLDL